MELTVRLSMMFFFEIDFCSFLFCVGEGWGGVVFLSGYIVNKNEARPRNGAGKEKWASGSPSLY